MAVIQADRPLTPILFEQFEDVQGTVKYLNVPRSATYAYIQAQGGDIRWRDDGTDPTSLVGHILADGDDHWYTGDLRKFAFIREDSVTATTDVSVSYYNP